MDIENYMGQFQINFGGVETNRLVFTDVENILESSYIEYVWGGTIDGSCPIYLTEIKTIYGQLQEILKVKVEPAPDEWDRLYNVDFFIKINGDYIGLQIKPVSGVSHIPQIFKERSLQEITHKKFTDKFGGRVFYVISIKEGNNKRVHNTEVIPEIKAEIGRLQDKR